MPGPNVILDEIEPLPDMASDYRAAALQRLETLKLIDFWLTTSPDARLAWVVVALTLNLTSTRGWTFGRGRRSHRRFRVNAGAQQS